MDRQGLENNNMDKHHCSCIDCGIVFASPMDLQKHVKRGCPENEEPAAKRFYPASSDESEDESGWNDIVKQVYGRYDDNYSQKVKTYENDGYSNVGARQKATEDLFQKYKRGIIKRYADMLKTMNSLKHSVIHREVIQELQKLMEEKHYSFDRALKIALRSKTQLFDELVDSEEDTDTSSDTDSSGADSDSQTNASNSN